MNIEGTTLEDAVGELTRLKGYAPFRFSGVWHIAIIGGKARAYRSRSALTKAAAKHGLNSIAIATL